LAKLADKTDLELKFLQFLGGCASYTYNSLESFSGQFLEKILEKFLENLWTLQDMILDYTNSTKSL
jgi:hypothetical protein